MMELLGASASETASDNSGIPGDASDAGAGESSSGRELAPIASRQRKIGGEEESVQASSVSCLRGRKTPAPRVLSRLLQLDAQRQHPSFPTTASAAAAVLLAFATAPIRAGSAAGLSTPASVSASCSPASPTGDAHSPRTAAVASCSMSSASTVGATSSVAATAARFATAAVALTPDSAMEPRLGRSSTIEEEMQQLLREEDGLVTAATSYLVDSKTAADTTTTATTALQGEQHPCVRTLAAKRGEDATYEDGGEATAVSATPEGQPEAAVTGGAKAECHLEAVGEAQPTKRGESRDNEATSEQASSSVELVESCVVPWKPTCLTEISFDYSLSSTKGDGAVASLSPYGSQRSNTSEPADSSPADRGVGTLPAASANALCSSLWNRWPSGPIEPAQCGAVSVRGASSVRTPHRRQGSMTSEPDPAAATEGIPSNVSRWRLGRATPTPQQKQNTEQPEVMQQQQVSELRLQQQHNNGDDEHETPLQRQVEAALKEQQEEKNQNVLLGQLGQQVAQRPPEQHLKRQVDLQDKQPGAHDELPMKTQTLLQTEGTEDLILQRRKQQRTSEEISQQQRAQTELEQAQQSHQQQSHPPESVQYQQFKDAEVFFNLMVEQLQQQQQVGQQSPDGSCGQQLDCRPHSPEQDELQQHHYSEKANISFQEHELPLRDHCEESVVLQQQQHHPPTFAELPYEAFPAPAAPAAASLPGEAFSTVATPAAAALAAPASCGGQISATARGASIAGVTPATVSLPEATRPLPPAVASGGILAAAAAAAALAAEQRSGKEGAAPCRQRYVQPRPSRRKRKNRGGCFVQTSSSGYPGVSWNRRMGAWLAFFYDTQSRRSRTFHPRYFNGDIEATRIAAIEFKKSVDRLFSSAPKSETAQPYTVSLQGHHEQDKEQKVHPREEEDYEEQVPEEEEQDEDPKEGKKQREQPPGMEEQKENPEQHHVDLDLNGPPQQVSEWPASLLPLQGQKSQPIEKHEEKEQRKHEDSHVEDKGYDGSSGSDAARVLQDVLVGQEDDAREAATGGRKRGGEDDAAETAGAATGESKVSPCLTLPSFISVADLASALLPPVTALNELETRCRDAGASCSNDATTTEVPSGPPVAPVGGAAAVHEEVANTTSPTAPVRDDTNRGTSAAASPPQPSLAGATIKASAVSPTVGVDLSVLAAMGSQERLQKVLTFETDLPGNSAHRLAFSWSRLSTLSTETLNGFYKSSRPSRQLLAQGSGAACPATGGAAGTATEEAGREGCKAAAAAAATIHQLLRQAQGEEEEKEDEQKFNMPYLLQQLQLHEGAAAASISSSEMHLDDALLREGEEELHRILERSYGLFPLPFLWRRELRFSDSKEASPEATTHSRPQDENSSTSQKDIPVCNSSSSRTESIPDRGGRSGTKEGVHASKDRSNSIDGTSFSMSGIATNGNSNNKDTGSDPAILRVKSDERYAESLVPNAQCSSMEKLSRSSSEIGKEHEGEEADGKYHRGNSLPFLARELSITGEDLARTSPEILLKQAVDAFQLNWRKSGVGEERGLQVLPTKGAAAASNARQRRKRCLKSRCNIDSAESP